MGVRVQREDFDVGAEVRRLTAGRTDIGAIVTFTGVMRSENDGASVSGMTLEHYPGMTEVELARVEAEAGNRWPLQASLIMHRVGALNPGDNIVLVVTASAHREAAFAAAEFLMDYLKTRAPFWKKEETADGTGTWVDARETDDAAPSSAGRGTIERPGRSRADFLHAYATVEGHHLQGGILDLNGIATVPAHHREHGAGKLEASSPTVALSLPK